MRRHDLDRIDRCTSCHVGMDEFSNPSLTNDFTKNPYKAHPDITGLIKNHPFRKYGCTECHGGQGLATTVEAGHGNLHFIIGKASFPDTALVENYAAAIDEVLRLKPSAAKGRYLKKAAITTTMGPSVPVDPSKTRGLTEEFEEAGT